MDNNCCIKRQPRHAGFFNQHGQGTAEYIAIAILVAILILASVRVFGRSLACQFSGAAKQVRQSHFGSSGSNGCDSGEVVSDLQDEDTKPPIRHHFNRPPLNQPIDADAKPPIRGFARLSAAQSAVPGAAGVAVNPPIDDDSKPPIAALGRLPGPSAAPGGAGEAANPPPQDSSTATTTVPAGTSALPPATGCYRNMSGADCSWRSSPNRAGFSCYASLIHEAGYTCQPLQPVRPGARSYEGMEQYCNGFNSPLACAGAQAPGYSIALDAAYCSGKCS